jgi:hypothetical protein
VAEPTGAYVFQRVMPPIISTMKPVKLQGNTLIISDSYKGTEIIDLETGYRAAFEDFFDQEEESTLWKKV